MIIEQITMVNLTDSDTAQRMECYIINSIVLN